ncbi:OmpA family protein [Rahnella aquatilis]|uniref:OmpA family protein n=1 Tax=Rahnella aquatilis TaxID=34038 RepID=UPI0036568267
MRGLTQLILLPLAACLSLWLILGFWPLGTGNRIVLSMLVSIISVTIGYFQWRRYNRDENAQVKIADAILPPEGFQGAVVLVCGDSMPLFSVSMPFRETRQGWYLPVALPEDLPLLAQHLAAERPALIAQISVLLAIVPEQHQDKDDFIQKLHVWHRAIVQCKSWLTGIPSVWVSTWLSPPVISDHQAERWFTITPEHKDVQVHEVGAGVIPLVKWSQQVDARNGQERLSAVFWMESLLPWLEIHISDILSRQQGDVPALIPCVWGVCFTPVTGNPNNLWQGHIGSVTTLAPVVAHAQECLPLPEVLLPYLPHRHGVSRLMQAWQTAGLLCGVFLFFALLASFVNNQRLVQSVGDHLTVYNHLTGAPASPKTIAQQQLRADARLLDEWLRSGAPMRMSLGLYQGMRLIAPLGAAINSWTPPAPPSPVITQIVQGPKTIRLNSLSLFDVGTSELKTDSTKVLVNALVGIKARPGWLIVIAGHTDITGDEKSNQLLSFRRAESVRSWMRGTGDIPESCFAVQGYGATRPIATNDTPEGRAANRRVEISLVPQADACQATATPHSSND